MPSISGAKSSQSFATDGGGIPIQLSPIAVGGQIASADTSLNQLVGASGTNTDTHTSTTFELTGVDTSTTVDFDGWILEITQAGYTQKRRILSTTW